ncbi:MAG: heparan-alpha-glucosaminide N-acetyltransferase domain-containing protein [Candidatus Solibacter sp.]|nr:heparan-alpha-glucosaminide N-acetyltransferase domain-containing protein [Candidatus Solibacter sp.]
MKRFPFLDWMRGLAVVIMIQCHTFNSFTRLDLREGGPYVLTQFVGGMAAPLFLLMAGMTTAFQMESLERREPSARRRWMISLKRAGYILTIAFTFRFTNWLFSMPHAGLGELTKVDILNCMGVGMAVLAVAAVFPSHARTRFAVGAGLLIAAVSPLMTNLPWAGTPALLQEYLVPGPGRGRFPFFPWVAYIAFGLAIGTMVKRAAAERFERLMQWSMLVGFSMIFIGQYFSNIPYSVYTNANFWTDSPALIVIRVGICLMIMAGAYLWTEYCVGAGWSWMQAMGKNSLMVYWVHVMIVYGSLVRPFKRALSIPQAALAVLVVTLMMVVMSALWLAWKGRKAALPAKPAPAVA